MAVSRCPRMSDFVLALTGPLSALVGLAALLVLIGAWCLDSARQRRKRTRLVALAVASRASRLSDCPQEFLDKLAVALHLEDESL